MYPYARRRMYSINILFVIGRLVYVVHANDYYYSPIFNLTYDNGANLARAVRADCRLRHAPVCMHDGGDECEVVGDTLQCVLDRVCARRSSGRGQPARVIGYHTNLLA